MKVNDFLLYTFDADQPAITYSAEILSVDTASSFFTCRQLDDGEQYTVQFSENSSGPWQGQDSQGASHSMNTHDVYAAAAADLAPHGAAVVTFADNSRYLCEVESVSPTIDVVFYQQPFPRLSFDGAAITQSDWDAYPVGGQIVSVEAYALESNEDKAATGPVAPVAGTAPAAGAFSNGWWSLARQLPAFAGRIGANITPFAVVVHTTDMAPETWNTLLHSWTTQAGKGDCAHFIIGRDAASGIVQMAPITKNANHAGGSGQGSFVAGRQTWRPNSVSVGIEVHCAGIVKQKDGAWRLMEGTTPQGAAIPESDVVLDPARPGVGYHIVTDYQYEQLGLLLDGLETVLADLPDGCVAQSKEKPPQYGVFPTGRRVGHVSLDAADRGDPWGPTCDWIRARA